MLRLARLRSAKSLDRMPMAWPVSIGSIASIASTTLAADERSMPHHRLGDRLIARDSSWTVPVPELRTKYSDGSVHGMSLAPPAADPNTMCAASALIAVSVELDGT